MTVCLRGSAMQSSSPTEPTPRPRRSKHHQCPIPSIPNAPRVPAQGPVQPSRRTPSTVPAARGRNSELSSHDASRPEHALVHLHLKPPLGAGSQRACVRRTAMHVAGFSRGGSSKLLLPCNSAATERRAVCLAQRSAWHQSLPGRSAASDGPHHPTRANADLTCWRRWGRIRR